MRLALLLLSLFAAAAGLTRKQLLRTAAASGLALPLLRGSPRAVLADEGKGDVDVYFGCGCFWHVQHEFVELERKLLGRDGTALTSRVGYAGGKRLGEGGKVCYHNLRGIADYGRLGHAEVVGMRIPEDKLESFADLYFKLFVKYDVPGMEVFDRNDPMDKGPEYRSLLGLPGGVESPLFPIIERANSKKMKLVAGKGDEPDTLLKRTVYVMDTKDFPFHRGEYYHHFHDDFMPGGKYGKEYNGLRNTLFDAGMLDSTGCPDTV